MLKTTSTYRFAALVPLGLTLLATDALAQNRISDMIRDDRQLSFARTPKDLQPEPITYKGFNITAELDTRTEYIDNVYYETNNQDSDTAVVVEPALRIQKNIRDHSAILSLSGKQVKHLDLTDEDRTLYNGALNLNLQATKSLKIPIKLMAGKQEIARSAPRSSIPTEVPTFDVRGVSTGFDYSFNRLKLQFLGAYEVKEFEDGLNIDTGNTIFFSQKDRSRTQATLTASYELPASKNRPAEHVLFAGVTYGKEDYDTFLDGTGNDTSDIRNNTFTRFLAGIKTRYKDLIVGDIGFGFISYDYESEQAEAIEDFDISADLDFLITPKFTLGFEASRDVNQENDFVQGFVDTRYKIDSQYEFQHNLYGTASIYRRLYEFDDLNREDEVLGGELGLRYLHSKRFESVVGARYETQESDTQNRDYDQMILHYTLKSRF